MSLNSQSIGKIVLQALSKVFLVVGALVFLVGDRFLREFFHADLMSAELAGIGGGLALCIVGAAMKLKKDSKD